MDFGVVRDQARFEELLRALSGSATLGLDTEFRRERTYYPVLCLLQVSTPELVACVDPLALDDLGPLLDLVYDPARTKVLHAARQDLEIFYQMRGALPAPLFDTQLAAAFLGIGDQVGYGPLVERLLGVSLAKAHTRTDWCRRPLSPQQVVYAEDDVRYLPALHDVLRDRLEAAGRLSWLEEETRGALLDPELYALRPEAAHRRIGRGRELPGEARRRLAALAAWRERRARASDLPRNWVATDAALVHMAQQPPGDRGALSRVEGLHPRSGRRWGGEILAALRDLPEGEAAAHGGRPSPEQQERVRALMAEVKGRAEAAGIVPSLVATRKDLVALVQGARDLPLLRGWRREFLGASLLAALEGGAGGP